jgi:PilZ domain
MLPRDGSPSDVPRVLLERIDPRRPIKTEALIRNVTQGRIGGQLLDISEHGCKIDLFDTSASPGQIVTIKLDNMESWTGHVRWVKERIIGVEFDRALHSAVVDHLSRSRMSIAFA